jgi:hypothetical protein
MNALARSSAIGIESRPPCIGEIENVSRRARSIEVLGSSAANFSAPCQGYRAARDSGQCSRQSAPGRRCILACVKFPSRVLTALNLLPSIATLASLNSSGRRHSTTNSRQTLPMASPLFFGKSAIVLKSAIKRPVSQTNSMLRWHSRSRRRLDCTRLRYP